MPMLLGAKGAEILNWRASAELMENLKQRLAGKWGRSSAREAEEFLKGLIGSLDEELCYESQMDGELSSLHQAVAAARSPGELKPLQGRHREVVSAHFSRRGSVLALCDARNRLHDALLTRAAQLAEERMLGLGQGSAPIYALLASGDRGRDEETLYSKNRYILLHELDSPRFFLFSHQLSTALREAGVLNGEDALWHGSLTEWRTLLKGGAPPRLGSDPQLAPLPPFAAPTKQPPPSMAEWEWRLEAMADLCFVTGFEPLALQAMAAAAGAVKEQKNRDPFFQLARRVINLPLALGHFGRWRLERDGEHKGEIDVEGLALSPLVLAIRVLAVHAEVHEGGTLQRVRELLNKGALDVDLAERLLKAFQCLMQLRIESEIRGEQAGAFVNPEGFDLEQDARIRSSVESVLSLQKIAYQRMVGQV